MAIDISKQKRAENELQASYATLEDRVVERTQTLNKANQNLKREAAERQRVEHQLRQAQKMEAVGQLTAGVAHDFNNMLAVILGNAELLEDQLGQNNAQLSDLCRATERAADLTQHLLAFSRKQMLNPEQTNIGALIAETASLLERSLEEYVEIEIVTAADLWNCEIDPTQLSNGLVNLAVNARDAMPDGGQLTIEAKKIRFDAGKADYPADVDLGDFVELAVTDTGTGMPADIIEHVFEPFFTTKPPGTGSGLGLSMVYGFVKQSEGEITIQSAMGKGTTVKLYLPRSTEERIIEQKPKTEFEPAGKMETILVVEDSPDVRALVVTLLEDLGYKVLQADSGTAALQHLGGAASVDLLLTDVIMAGGMNGQELADQALQIIPKIKILFMSGYTNEAIHHKGRLNANATVLHKPFRRTDIARAVRQALN